MYNNEVKQSQAWFAMEEIINAAKELHSSTNSMEEAARGAVDTIGELEGDLNEAQDDYEQAEQDLHEIKSKMHSFDPVSVIRLMDQIEIAGAALVNFAVNTRMDVREAYEIEDPDSGTRDSSNDRTETIDGSSDGQAAAEGIEGS